MIPLAAARAVAYAGWKAGGERIADCRIFVLVLVIVIAFAPVKFMSFQNFEENVMECHEEPATGVLLSNLGTPAAPTAGALRRFLREFLWDPRVVEWPRPLWWLLLGGVILPLRPRRSARLYRRIWTAEGSPLLVHSRRQAAAFEEAMRGRAEGALAVELGMRYGVPSIHDALVALRRRGCQRILLLPLYPQYCAATSGSTFDAVAETLKQWRWVPELRTVNHYHDDLGYIGALAASVRECWQREGPPDKLLISFHGLPLRYFLAGDPYPCQCRKTARLLAEALELPGDRWQVSFQSRFGREEWLKPSTDQTLKELAGAGTGRVDVICPGFAADCLETLEEIAITNREIFYRAGGQRFRYIPALNDRPEHIQALAALAERHLQGWAASRV